MEADNPTWATMPRHQVTGCGPAPLRSEVLPERIPPFIKYELQPEIAQRRIYFVAIATYIISAVLRQQLFAWALEINPANEPGEIPPLAYQPGDISAILAFIPTFNL